MVSVACIFLPPGSCLRDNSYVKVINFLVCRSVSRQHSQLQSAAGGHQHAAPPPASAKMSRSQSHLGGSGWARAPAAGGSDWRDGGRRAEELSLVESVARLNNNTEFRLRNNGCGPSFLLLLDTHISILSLSDISPTFCPSRPTITL